MQQLLAVRSKRLDTTDIILPVREVGCRCESTHANETVVWQLWHGTKAVCATRLTQFTSAPTSDSIEK